MLKLARQRRHRPLPLSDRGLREGLAEAQPFYVNSPYGIASRTTATSSTPTRCDARSFEDDRRHINTDSDSEVLLNVLAHELQIQDRIALTPRPHLQGGRRRCMRVLGRLRGRRADPRLRRARVPRSARHPAARARRARDRERRGIRGRVGIRRARHPRLQARCATSRRAKRCSSTLDGKLHSRQCAERARRLHAVHLRIRLSRAARFDDRGRVGLQGAPAHGREARREDPARDARITTSTR